MSKKTREFIEPDRYKLNSVFVRITDCTNCNHWYFDFAEDELIEVKECINRDWFRTTAPVIGSYAYGLIAKKDCEIIN